MRQFQTGQNWALKEEPSQAGSKRGKEPDARARTAATRNCDIETRHPHDSRQRGYHPAAPLLTRLQSLPRMSSVP